MRLADNLPYNIFPDNILETISKTSFNILATDWNNNTACFSWKSIGSNTSFNKYRIFSETIHLFKFMIFLCNYDCAFFDYIEGICVIAFIEDYLSLLVCLGVAGGGECIFLFFC